MKDVPQRIYLQIGPDCDAESFNELAEVTWNKERVYPTDLEYTAGAQFGQSGWVRVEDRLPDWFEWGGATVLVCLMDGTIETAYFHDGRWQRDLAYQITHWRPLPDPPLP